MPISSDHGLSDEDRKLLGLLDAKPADGSTNRDSLLEAFLNMGYGKSAGPRHVYGNVDALREMADIYEKTYEFKKGDIVQTKKRVNSFYQFDGAPMMISRTNLDRYNADIQVVEDVQVLIVIDGYLRVFMVCSHFLEPWTE